MKRQILAFLKKDFLVESSYKLSFLLNIFTVFVSILAYFFIDRLFGQRVVGHLEEFGVNYFSYVLLGMAFFSYLGAGLSSVSDRIRAEQMQGTLEAIILTPCKIPTILFSLSLWNFCFATLNVCIYIISGIFLFGINFTNINISSTVIVLLLSIVSFSGLGILSASFIIILKRGNPVGWIINSLEGLLGGVYFPVTVMPTYLQFVAKFLPITYAIRAIELAVYKGYTILQLRTELFALILFALLLLPLSLFSFRYALKKARYYGSLSQY